MAFDRTESLYDLHGKVAVVTGGASGIGRATATRLSERGAALIVADVNEEAAAKIASALAGNGTEALAVAVDVREVGSGAIVAALAMERLGRLDVLVNCAGVYPSMPALDVTEEHWDRIMDINLKGTFFMTQGCARAMIEAGNGGAVVNISSKTGVRARSGVPAYSASKAGVISLTESFAQELAPHHIRVNAVAPGPIETESTPGAAVARVAGTGQTVEQWRQAYLDRIPLHRYGTPDEIARAIEFLATDASAYATGSILTVDGGALLP